MPHSPNRPEVYTKAWAFGRTDFPVGFHRLPNRAKRSASCASVSRSPTRAGHPSFIRSSHHAARGIPAVRPALGATWTIERHSPRD